MILLDLFCGAGVTAWGYWRSGKFSQIIGVDIADKSRVYPFDFIQADALSLTYEFLAGFSFIHASPPCQAYSKITPKKARANHQRLIAATHLMCTASGLPYVIENVEGSTRELSPSLALTGWNVGLPMTRKRYFHLSWIRSAAAPNIRTAVGANQYYQHKNPTRDQTIAAMFGDMELPTRYINRLTIADMEQAAPPAMAAYIATLAPGEVLRIG